MTDQPRLLDAHRRISEGSRPGPSPAPADTAEPPWTTIAGYLSLRGWEHRTRMGKRIWRKEDEAEMTGFRGWYGESFAYLFAEREERGDA